jgi:hypothetical protein
MPLSPHAFHLCSSIRPDGHRERTAADSNPVLPIKLFSVFPQSLVIYHLFSFASLRSLTHRLVPVSSSAFQPRGWIYLRNGA